MPVTTEEQDEWGSIIHDGKQSMFFLLFFLSRKRRKIQVLPSVTFIPCSLQVFLWYFIRACPTTTEYSTLFFWKNRKKILKRANKQANKKKHVYIPVSCQLHKFWLQKYETVWTTGKKKVILQRSINILWHLCVYIYLFQFPLRVFNK